MTIRIEIEINENLPRADRWVTGVEPKPFACHLNRGTGPHFTLWRWLIFLVPALTVAIPAELLVPATLPLKHIFCLVPAMVLGLFVRGLLFFALPFGCRYQLGGDLPLDVLSWPLPLRRALDEAEWILTDPWDGAGQQSPRLRQAIRVLERAVGKQEGEAADRVRHEAESLRGHLKMLG